MAPRSPTPGTDRNRPDPFAPAGGGGPRAACALALLLAAAAVAAADAHAQSNTQRLADIDSATAGMSNVVDAIRDALDGAAAGLAEMLAAITGVRDSADSVLARADSAGSNASELRGEIRALRTGVSGAGAAASNLGGAATAAGAAAESLAGKVSALDAGAAAVREGVASLDGGASSVREGMASLNAGAAAAGAAAESLAGNVSVLGAGASAARNLAGALDAKTDALAASVGIDTANGAHAKMDAIYDELVRHGAAPSGADGAAAGGIAAANARLDSLEAALQRVESALLALDADLRSVETTVAEGAPGQGGAGPTGIPTTLHQGTERYDVTLGHYGDSFGGKKLEPVNTELAPTYAMSCKADVFVGTVNATLPPYGGIGVALSADNAFTLSVEGRTLYDNYFDPGDGNEVFHWNSPDFNLMELKAGRTLDFRASWWGNHTNGSATSGIGLYMDLKHGETAPLAHIPPYLKSQKAMAAGIVKPNYTKAELGAIVDHTAVVHYYSAARDAECSFQRTSGPSTGPAKGGKSVLAIRTSTTGLLVNGFEGTLDCNNLPTTITGVAAEVPGGLELHRYSALRLMAGSGDGERVLAAFGFNGDGTLAHSGGGFPFTFEGSPLRINGTLAGATDLLVVVDYRTTGDNSCG